MPAIIGSFNPAPIGSPKVTLNGLSAKVPSGSTGGSSGGQGPSPGGPVVRPVPGNLTVQAVAQTYRDYRTLIDGLRQYYPGAISDSDWISTFAPGTAFDTNMSDSVLPFTGAPATTLSNGDPAPPLAILTNLASTLLLLRIDLQKTVGGALSALWIDASTGTQGGPFGKRPTGGGSSGVPPSGGGSSGVPPSGGGSSGVPASNGGTGTIPPPARLVGKLPTPWAAVAPPTAGLT
jgi:hypothetical protein